jgi:O-antigen ligase
VFEDKKRALMGISTTVFISSLIMFDLSHNGIYNNVINILFIILFVTVMIYEKDYRISIPDIAITYFLFAFLALISMLWAVDFETAYSYRTRVIIITINFVVLYSTIKRYNLEQTILYGLLLGGLYNILIGIDIIQPSFDTYLNGRFIGCSGNSNKLARIMMFSIFSSLVILSLSNIKTWFKFYNYINILFSLYIIALTVSKKIMILAPIMILLSLSFKDFKIKNIVIASLFIYISIQLLVNYIDPQQLEDTLWLIEKRFSGMSHMASGQTGDASSMERVALIRGGLNLFYDNPFLGIGLNNAIYIMGKYTHSNYVELLSNVGLIGTLFFYMMYLFTLRNIYYMPLIKIKKYFYIMIFILLITDIASISYFRKPFLVLLLYIYFVAEKEGEKYKKNINSSLFNS